MSDLGYAIPIPRGAWNSSFDACALSRGFSASANTFRIAGRELRAQRGQSAFAISAIMAGDWWIIASYRESERPSFAIVIPIADRRGCCTCA